MDRTCAERKGLLKETIEGRIEGKLLEEGKEL